MQRKRKPKVDDTPLSKRIIMAVVGILILLVLYYFFGHNRFPTEITYRQVTSSGSNYIMQRENPGAG